jgi:hypothetical protein
MAPAKRTFLILTYRNIKREWTENFAGRIESKREHTPEMTTRYKLLGKSGLRVSELSLAR